MDHLGMVTLVRSFPKPKAAHHDVSGNGRFIPSGSSQGRVSGQEWLVLTGPENVDRKDKSGDTYPTIEHTLDQTKSV